MARHSKIILNLYKKTNNNETTTDMKYVEKKQRKQKMRNTEFIKIGGSSYFHNVYPITERHMYMVNKSSIFQSDFRLESSNINKYHLSYRSFKLLPKNCLIKWVAIKKNSNNNIDITWHVSEITFITDWNCWKSLSNNSI